MRDPLIDELIEADKANERKDKIIAASPIVSGDMMLTTEYPEIQFHWDDVILQAGLHTVAGAKAGGKTLLILQAADAISKGLPFMGMKTSGAKVLFIELELSQRRTAERLAKMGIVPGRNLHFLFTWDHKDAVEALEAIITNGRYGLVIVDVLQRLWPREIDANSYQDSYTFLGPLRQLAYRLNVAILLVTHRRKQMAPDRVDEVMGSTGIVANSDVILSIARTRGEDSATLLVDGNDIETRKIALDFCTNPLGFKVSDASPEEIEQTPERREILNALRQLGGTGKPGQIAGILGKDRSLISHLIGKMAKDGLVILKEYGVYSLYKYSGHSVHTVHSEPLQESGSVNDVNDVKGYPATSQSLLNLPEGEDA